jgi:hypothetical protein
VVLKQLQEIRGLSYSKEKSFIEKINKKNSVRVLELGAS